MYDLHLHSTYSDGDQSVAQLVDAAARAGVTGLSLTDHNGLWGITEASSLAEQYGLDVAQGIEISAHTAEADAHILGYSREFDQRRMTEGLAQTREGYQRRTHRMIVLCQQAGYAITPEDVFAVRQGQRQSVYMAYDVARALARQCGLSPVAARALTTHGGTCHVSYGSWALTPAAAVDLIHRCGGLAVLAHAGTIARETSAQVLRQILANLVAAGLDGVEVHHPFHDAAMVAYLTAYATTHNLLVTGGSDWHGLNRYHEGALGKIGLTDAQATVFLQALKVP